VQQSFLHIVAIFSLSWNTEGVLRSDLRVLEGPQVRRVHRDREVHERGADTEASGRDGN
jgi:hypothetical protein